MFDVEKANLLKSGKKLNGPSLPCGLLYRLICLFGLAQKLLQWATGQILGDKYDPWIVLALVYPVVVEFNNVRMIKVYQILKNSVYFFLLIFFILSKKHMISWIGNYEWWTEKLTSSLWRFSFLNFLPPESLISFQTTSKPYSVSMAK